MAFCRFCGANIDDDAEFCTKCGHAVNMVGNSTPCGNDNNSSKLELIYEELKSNKRGYIIPIALALIIILLVFILIGVNSGKSAPVNLSGTYEQNTGQSIEQYIFRSDGTFTTKRISTWSKDVKVEEGQYVIRDNTIFFISSGSALIFRVVLDGDTLILYTDGASLTFDGVYTRTSNPTDLEKTLNNYLNSKQ